MTIAGQRNKLVLLVPKIDYVRLWCGALLALVESERLQRN
jgi:hypothetical protein